MIMMLTKYQKSLLNKIYNHDLRIRKYSENGKQKIGIFDYDHLIKNISKKIFDSWVNDDLLIAWDHEKTFFKLSDLGKLLVTSNLKIILRDLIALQDETIRVLAKKRYESTSSIIRHIEAVQRLKHDRTSWNGLAKVSRSSIKNMLQKRILTLNGIDYDFGNDSYYAYNVINGRLAEPILSMSNKIYLKDETDLEKLGLTWEEWKKLPILTQEYLTREKEEDPEEWKRIKAQVEKAIGEDE